MMCLALSSYASITLTTNHRENMWTYHLSNEFACPVQVLIKYTNNEGKEEVLHRVIPPYSTEILLCLTNTREPQFVFQHELGDPFLEPQDVEYWLPFAPNQMVRVTQGYNTRFSHKGKNAYSIDFAASIGTPVYAARDGVVVMVRTNSRLGGNRKVYRGYANYIIIYHEDGTFAHYVHLKYRGAVVKPGDYVKAGQLIGYSGNTGWTKGPHLHFMVTRAGYMDRFSIPVKFYTSDGPLTNLVARNFYLIEHPFITVAHNPPTITTNATNFEAIGEDEGDMGAP
jgi:murein DD-endopeptidase MepM/ murein hydrolase activator NlpD